MKNLRTQFNRWCYRNQDKGIPNLMLYIVLGTAVVYVISQITGNFTLYYLLCFDRSLILRGQVWRLITYPFTYGTGNSNLLLIAISLFCYYSLGRIMEQRWGTLRFNLFYFSGMVLMDVYCMLFGGFASVTYLNMSLFLGYATMFPDSQFLLFFIIPIRARIFALIELAIVALELFTSPFPGSLFPIIALANYFLFFGSEVLGLLPPSWQARVKRGAPRQTHSRQGPRVIQFQSAPNQSTRQNSQPQYNHRCTICGRTDVSHPDLEFRYCSRCRGYHCYCEDHISNHVHIE